MKTADLAQIVTFRLGDDHFAADIFAVERVLRYQPPTAVPNVPGWIEGVIDFVPHERHRDTRAGERTHAERRDDQLAMTIL